MGKMSKADAIETIQDCQDRLLEVIRELQQVARSLDDRHAEAYIVDHLKILTSADHGFLDSSYNLDEWLQSLEGAEAEAED